MVGWFRGPRFTQNLVCVHSHVWSTAYYSKFKEKVSFSGNVINAVYNKKKIKRGKSNSHKNKVATSIGLDLSK